MDLQNEKSQFDGDENIENRNYFIESVDKSIEKLKEEKCKMETISNIETFHQTSDFSFNLKHGIKCSYGSCDEYKNYLELLEYDAKTLGRLNFVEKSNVIDRALWIPDPNDNYPELLLVASEDLHLYELVDWKLVRRGFALYAKAENPIISCEWNCNDPATISTLHYGGQCIIWSIESEKAIFRLSEDFLYKPKLKLYNGGPYHEGMCFCHDSLQSCVLTYNDENKCFLHDLRIPCSKFIGMFPNRIVDMKCSLLNLNFIGFFFKTHISIVDIRNTKKECYSFKNFKFFERGTCFAWSPFDREIAIGTSRGCFILWKPEMNMIRKISNQNIKLIEKIAYHPLEKNILFLSSDFLSNINNETKNHHGINVVNVLNES